jgi:hypothetical protein
MADYSIAFEVKIELWVTYWFPAFFISTVTAMDYAEKIAI